MSNPEAGKLIIDIAKQFLSYAFESPNNWHEAYLRYSGNKNASGLTSIYRHGQIAEFYDFDEDLEDQFYEDVRASLKKLQDAVTAQQGKEFCVCLLSINPECDYHFYYEYEDTEKWEISKMDGQSGIPQIDKTE